MKKIINTIKEKDNIIIFILFFFVSLGICLNLSIEASDEIWNFQNVYKMYNGFKIYEEINVIITPFFFWCAKIIFHILGANLCVFRVCHSVLMAVLSLFTYKILKKLDIPKKISLLTVSMIIVQQFFLFVRTSFNYNSMALLFFIIGVYYLINEKTRKNIYIQAFITLLIIGTKQNIGVYYLIGNIVYFIFSQVSIRNKIKKSLKYLGSIFLGSIAFIIYLLLDNNLYNFFNYTLGGILEFANENLNIEITSIIYMISITLINIGISAYIIKKNYFSEKQKENIKILFIFSIMLCLTSYPIFNWGHIIIGTYLMIINVVYIVYTLLKDFEDFIQKIVKYVNIVLTLVMIIFSTSNMYLWIKMITSDNYPYLWEEPFFGGNIAEEEYQKNNHVKKYIEENEKNVIVLSNKAALYMIPLKRNNGDFDLPFKGNLGIKGEDGLIEKVNNMVNTQFLIVKDKNQKNYQESIKVDEYIKNTKKYTGEIEGFEIYE